jgi:uracil-DNA glycosylase
VPDFCPGYVTPPFDALAADYPDETTYPRAHFRTEWGPIFHRGRLDGSARVLVIGQDPGQHENVLRRILVGEAGRRAQGFLAKLGVTRRYVFINALLYSVYGDQGAKYVAKPAVCDYRNRWIAAILAGRVQAVVTLGAMAKRAWQEYVKTLASPPALAVEHLVHPTFPESGGGSRAIRALNTKKMLNQWNASLRVLHAAVTDKDLPDAPLELYGAGFAQRDKADIPSADLPAGVPRWMYDDDGWAARVGSNPRLKRRTITITVPEGIV